MTTLQLKLAVYIQELGSISNAAKFLDISQPNASNYIKTLESEIGFVIFNRSKNGIKVTEKGNIFLERAKRILDEQEEIMNIQKQSDIYRLRLGICNYYSAANPFIKICEMHRDDPDADLRVQNVSVDEGIELLYKNDIDIIFAPARKSQLAGFISECNKNNLTLITLGQVPACISLRKGHPAIVDGRCKNITQGSSVMKDYPYVAYRNLSKDSASTGYNDIGFIQSKYIMYADDVNVRLKLVASTNAFCFGITPSRGVNEQYGLESFPVPGIFLEVFCIVRKTDCDKKEINEYLQLLKEEMNL